MHVKCNKNADKKILILSIYNLRKPIKDILKQNRNNHYQREG